MQVARLRKERTHPKLVGPRRRARLVGGRWSEEETVLVGQSEGQVGAANLEEKG